MTIEHELFEIRKDMAIDRFSKMDKDCNTYFSEMEIHFCTGVFQMKFSRDRYLVECDTCGSQVGVEGKNAAIEAEKIYLSRLIDQPDDVLTVL
jgi:hypothetical protein